MIEFMIYKMRFYRIAIHSDKLNYFSQRAGMFARRLVPVR